jgi:hypothetical protein
MTPGIPSDHRSAAQVEKGARQTHRTIHSRRSFDQLHVVNRQLDAILQIKPRISGSA